MKTDENIVKFQAGYEVLSKKINEIPREAILHKPADGSWSIAEVIVHLADSEAHGFVRAKKIIAECGGKVCVYNHQIWADNLFYAEMNFEDALELIRILRKNLLEVLKRVKKDAWNNYIYHPETGKITLQDWIQLYNDHIDIHVEQIQRIFSKWKKANKEEYA